VCGQGTTTVILERRAIMCSRFYHFVSFILMLCVVLSSTADAADANLVGWWKFDGDGLDASGNSHNGTLEGDAHFVEGYSGQALSLDGDGDFFTVNDYKGLMSTSDVTVTAWVNTMATGDQADITYWGRNSGGRRVDFRINNGRLRVEHGGGNLQGDTNLNDGEWHHVAVTIPAGSTVSYPDVKLYLDGQDDSRHTTDPDPPFRLAEHDSNVDLTIGRRVPQDDRHFIGMIDEVRIYDRVLAGTEIEDIMMLGYLASAHSPSLPNGEKLEDTWATLEWVAGPLAVSHNVYFGTSFEDVNAGAETGFVGNITETTQPLGFPGYPAPDGLVPGTTYYWRVDEVNDAHPDSPWQGEVWSFWIPDVTAYDPIPCDGEPAEYADADLSWAPGMKMIMQGVYFGTDADEVANATGAAAQMDTTFDPGQLDAATAYYWRVDTFDGSQWNKGPVWTFTTMPEIPLASDPNLVAWWKLDEGAGTNVLDWSGNGNHGKLFGTAWTSPKWLDDADGAVTFADDGFMAINNLNYSGPGRTEITACAWVRTDDPNDQFVVTFDRNEYWRLEINGNGAGNGQVGWDLMTINGGVEQQLDYGSITRVDDGFWHHLCGVFDNGTATIFIDGIPEPSVVAGPTFGVGDLVRYGFVGANSEADEFNGARGVETGVTGEVGDVRIYDRALTQEEILQVMRGDPLQAWDLRPPSRLVHIDNVPTTLTWQAGDDAAEHDVYFGADQEAVSSADATDTTGVYRGRQAGTSHVPTDEFVWGQNYYWRIDELNRDGSITKGGIRAIQVADFTVVDDFEAYDIGENQIWYAWLDGFGYGMPDVPPYSPGNGTGSAVGDETTGSYTEETIVYEGRHSMPLAYDNNKQGYAKYSEVELTLVKPRDWTKNEVAELSIWFYGLLANAAEPLYVAVTGSNGVSIVINHDNPDAATIEEWKEWVIPLQTLADQGVNLDDVHKLAIGLGTRGNTTIPGGAGTMYFDDIMLYRTRTVAEE